MHRKTKISGLVCQSSSWSFTLPDLSDTMAFHPSQKIELTLPNKIGFVSPQHHNARIFLDLPRAIYRYNSMNYLLTVTGGEYTCEGIHFRKHYITSTVKYEQTMLQVTFYAPSYHKK